MFFSLRLVELHASFSDPITPVINHDVIAGMDWMWHNHLYINWDTLVITLAWHSVSFQLYSTEMHKLLNDMVSVLFTEAKYFNYQGENWDFPSS